MDSKECNRECLVVNVVVVWLAGSPAYVSVFFGGSSVLFYTAAPKLTSVNWQSR